MSYPLNPTTRYQTQVGDTIHWHERYDRSLFPTVMNFPNVREVSGKLIKACVGPNGFVTYSIMVTSAPSGDELVVGQTILRGRRTVEEGQQRPARRSRSGKPQYDIRRHD